jgi:hypothetical protein
MREGEKMRRKHIDSTFNETYQDYVRIKDEYKKQINASKKIYNRELPIMLEYQDGTHQRKE